ncbi:MAG: hypothetical protein ACFFCW_39740 [Candidatus Hodarchaeota archaeon]
MISDKILQKSARVARDRDVLIVFKNFEAGHFYPPMLSRGMYLL